MKKKELKKLLKQIIAVDTTPEYSYSHTDENYRNMYGEAPPLGAKWMTPAETCENQLRLMR